VADRANKSLLPGAPVPDGERTPKGVHAIDLAGSRLAYVPVELEKLWDSDECPETLLPWLAWAQSVDIWDAAATTQQKRDLIKANRAWHKKKGTIGAVREVLAERGYPNAVIEEGIGQVRRDGTYHRTGLIRRSSGHWAFYKIVLDVADPMMDQQTMDLIARVAPERCVLAGIDYE